MRTVRFGSRSSPAKGSRRRQIERTAAVGEPPVHPDRVELARDRTACPIVIAIGAAGGADRRAQKGRADEEGDDAGERGEQARSPAASAGSAGAPAPGPSALVAEMMGGDVQRRREQHRVGESGAQEDPGQHAAGRRSCAATVAMPVGSQIGAGNSP